MLVARTMDRPSAPKSERATSTCCCPLVSRVAMLGREEPRPSRQCIAFAPCASSPAPPHSGPAPPCPHRCRASSSACRVLPSSTIIERRRCSGHARPYRHVLSHPNIPGRACAHVCSRLWPAVVVVVVAGMQTTTITTTTTTTTTITTNHHSHRCAVQPAGARTRACVPNAYARCGGRLACPPRAIAVTRGQVRLPPRRRCRIACVWMPAGALPLPAVYAHTARDGRHRGRRADT